MTSKNRIIIYVAAAVILLYLMIGVQYAYRRNCETFSCQTKQVFLWIADFDRVSYVFDLPMIGKRKICPSAWYENRMPLNEPPYPQYLIVEGERAELRDFNIDWITKNCEVTSASPVY